MTKISRFGQLIPQFLEEWFFFPWSVDQHVGLSEKFINPRADNYATICLRDHDRQDRATRERFIYAVAYYTTAVLSLCLGLWPSEVWHERDSGQSRGQKILAALSDERAQKWGAKPHFVWQCGVPSKREIIIMIDNNRLVWAGKDMSLSWLIIIKSHCQNLATTLVYYKECNCKGNWAQLWMQCPINPQSTVQW